MAASIRLSVRFTDETVAELNKIGPSVFGGWDEFLQIVLKNHDFPCTTVGHLASYIEGSITGIYNERLSKFVQGNKQLEMQIYRMQVHKSDEVLRFQDRVSEKMKPGDTLIVDAQSMLMSKEPREWTDQELKEYRKKLRFGLNDRVLCNFGDRWLSGHIVGTAVPVPDDDELLPYLVKTDPLPGLPSDSISVPSDDDDTCIQEICFDAGSQLHLIKAAASFVSEASKPKLRFAIGDTVVCRIRNDPKDGLEQWVHGTIGSIWPKLPGDDTWRMGDQSGKYPSVVPYKIDLALGGWVFCQKDDHTLVRRKGMEPVTRVKGISKRMEVRKNEDGSQERIDHVTERRKRLMAIASSDSE